MNKKGDAGWLVVKWVIAILLLVVISITIIPRLIESARAATDCAQAGGECLPMWTPNRELITGHHGVYTDCKELQGKSPTKYGCFARAGSSVGIQDETIPAGLHLFQLTYDEYPAQNINPNPAPFNSFGHEPELNPEKQILGRGEIILEEGRLYAFQAYSKNNKNKICSVYLREGGFSVSDNNIKGEAVSKQKCDNPDNPPTLLFVPTQAHVNMRELYIVLLPRETAEGGISDGRIEIRVRIRPVLNPCDLFFYDTPGTNTEALKRLSPSDRNPVSFALESSFARFEFTNMVMTPNYEGGCIPLEKYIITRDLYKGIINMYPNILINGDGLGIDRGSITVSDKRIKDAYMDWWQLSVNPIVSSWNKDNMKWERPDKYGVERIFRDGNTISYSILQPKAEIMAFRYFPGRCYEIKDEQRCFELTKMTAPDIVSCYWTDKRSGQCLPCRGDQYTEMVRSCEDYPETSCLLDDPCNINPGRGCVWNNRRLLRDKCVDAGFQPASDDACAGWRDCSDYKNEQICNANLCSDNKCEWKKRWYASDTCVEKQTRV